MKKTHTLLTPYEITDVTAEKLINSGHEIICISYGYQSFCDLIVYEEKIIKTISYEKLLTYSSDILYRMHNCRRYVDTLDIETLCDIGDILYDRYCDSFFGG